MYVRDWVARRAELSPEKLAVIDAATDARLTYFQLNDRATRLANFLRERCGVKSQDRVAVLAMNRTEILEVFFACAKLSAILVPLNYRLTSMEQAYILEDCTPRVLFYEDEFAHILSELREHLPNCRFIGFNTNGSVPAYHDGTAYAHAAPIEVDHFDAEMTAMIIYTSGTTGHPKGAMLSHRMLTWNSINTNLGWDLVSNDVTTVHAPLFHTGGFNVLTLPLLHAGGTCVMLRNFEPEAWLAAIERYRCTVVFGVPTMFQMMLDAPSFAETDLSSLRFFISGGAPCPIPLIEAFQKRGVSFTQGFGLTEVGPNCFKLDLADAVRKAGSIGFPTFHSQARIVDENGNDVAPGAVGELILKGLHVCSGYWRDPDATASAIVVHDHSGSWFHTGDLARQDDEGYFYVAGRAKDMIISGGENVYPAEIEALLHTHPAVAAAAVIGLSDPKWGEKVIAAIVKLPNAQTTEAEIIAFCHNKLARYKIPRRIFFMEEFPLSGSGKIVKRQVKQQIEKSLSQS